MENTQLLKSLTLLPKEVWAMLPNVKVTPELEAQVERFRLSQLPKRKLETATITAATIAAMATTQAIMSTQATKGKEEMVAKDQERRKPPTATALFFAKTLKAMIAEDERQQSFVTDPDSLPGIKRAYEDCLEKAQEDRKSTQKIRTAFINAFTLLLHPEDYCVTPSNLRECVKRKRELESDKSSGGKGGNDQKKDGDKEDEETEKRFKGEMHVELYNAQDHLTEFVSAIEDSLNDIDPRSLYEAAHLLHL